MRRPETSITAPESSPPPTPAVRSVVTTISASRLHGGPRSAVISIHRDEGGHLPERGAPGGRPPRARSRPGPGADRGPALRDLRLGPARPPWVRRLGRPRRAGGL